MLHYLLAMGKAKLEEKAGQGMTEYAIVVALVVIIAVAVLAQGGTLGAAITNLYSYIASGLTKVGNGISR